MSSLPTLDDLHQKASMSSRSQYFMVDTRPQRFSRPDLLVTSETIRQEQEARRSRAYKLLKSCKEVLSFQSRAPSYRPMHQMKRLPSKPPSRCSRCWLLAAVLGLLLLLVPALLLHLLARTAPPRTFHTWHENATFYEIFPASFLDTDSDGYGDFQGIIRRLNYISALGVTGIRLNSIFSALDYPLEYEHVIELRSPDPHLGRGEDVKQLVRECRGRNLRVLLDLNPALTSDQHTWALHWQRGITGYERFYASANRSKDPPEMENSEGPPPEEWELSQRTFGGHYFLNWSNPSVRDAYREALRHWLDMGVDGVYMKHLEKMHVTRARHLLDVIREWRRTLDESYGQAFETLRYAGRPPPPDRKILVVSSKFADHLKKTAGSKVYREVLQMVDLLDSPILVGSGKEIAEQVLSLRSRCSEGGKPKPMWHLGSADTFRMASRMEPRYRAAALYLLVALPGASSIFYGDEIGLKDSYDMQDGKVFRGGQLAPMHWTPNDANNTFGFTEAGTLPWMPPGPRLPGGDPDLLSRLLHFRRNTLPRFDISRHQPCLEVLEPGVLVVERTGRGAGRLLLAANFGPSSEDKPFPDSYGSVRPLLWSGPPTRSRVRSRGFTLSPGAAFFAHVRMERFPPPAILVE